MTKKKHSLLAIVSCILLLAMAIGFTSLYLTDNDTATNTVTVGDVKIDLLEPNWEDTNNVVPNQELPKDPQIKNVGINDAVVFMTVEVPVENITLTADDGTKGVKGNNELFWFKDSADDASVHANNFDTNWIHLDTRDTGANLAGTTRTYVFAYKTPISKDETTTALFDKIQVKNFIENEIPAGKTEQIKINAYGIQASDVLESGVDLTDTLSNANLDKIYGIFIKQAFNQTEPEHQDLTYNVENAAVQKHMATAAYNDNDHTYTYLDVNDCITANQKPAYGTLSVPDGAATITVTSSSDGKNFTDTLSDTEYHVQNLIPGVQYNYEMKNSSGTVVKTGTITPTGTVRMIAPNDGSIVSNIRDVGGVAANGGTLKYGKLYRGEALNGNTGGFTNSITPQFGEYMADFLGITYEQDLRQANEYPEYTESAIKNASYVRTPLVSAQVSAAYFSNSPQVTALTNLVNHLADGDVTYLHCMGGVDRTGGTLLILEGALGVSLSDIEHRQELSFWSDRNRTAEGTDGNYAHIMEYPRGTTLEEKCINFMMAHGISADAINRMRANLIDGTPSLVEGMTPFEVYDASASLLNTRLTSTTPRANDGTLVTNYIDYVQEAQFEITLDTANNTGTYNGWFEVYDENYTRILKGTSTYGTWKWGSDGKTAKWIPGGSAMNTSYTHEDGWAYKNPKYIRFCFAYNNASDISIKRIF